MYLREMDDPSEDSRPGQPGVVKKIFLTVSQRYQTFLDTTVPHLALRWISTLVMIVLFLVRVLYLQGWYIVTYALGIYHLNLFIAFLTPKIDPALEELGEEDLADQEFRPFIRRLPEFKFWYAATRAVVIAITCTFFEFFDIPVFWPILVMYFIVLFIITMKRQIKHMIRYRYLPFTYGKQKYRGKDESSDVMKS
ncbi:Protein RER1 [Stylophora pistillata]|uniref:Protein RER1 n=1 Tax=Stylophora pistillata TaxID=50429 RepID=A0A2B4SA73_STYPI|nr:Protein RER1 [Stylophora pistillata]